MMIIPSKRGAKWPSGCVSLSSLCVRCPQLELVLTSWSVRVGATVQPALADHCGVLCRIPCPRLAA